MPERNLVTFDNSLRNWQLGTVLCLIVSLQLGCSKIGSTSIRDLVTQQPDVPAWRQSDDDSLERQFLDDPDSFETLSVETAVLKGQAEFVTDESDSSDAMKDVTTESKPVRLTATALAQPDDDSSACESGQCKNSCCNSGTAVPKLPFAEPIEPPSTTAGPPSAIISQPLTPIVLKSSDKKEVGSSRNGLRPGSTFDKEGGLRTSQLAVSGSTPDPVSRAFVANPIRIGNLNRNEDLRAPEVNETPLAPELIASSSDTYSRRRVAVVAEPIPPFAECPPPDEPKLGGFEPSHAKQADEQSFFADIQVAAKNDISAKADSFAPRASNSAQDQAPSTIRVEDLNDEEFNELFGMPGVAVKQELKHLLKKRVVCDACGNFDCTGCFAPISAPPFAVKTVDDDGEIDVFPSPPERHVARPVAEAKEPQAFVPFEGTINSLASKVIPASHQENITPVSAAGESPADPEVAELRLLHAEFCTEIKGFGQIKRFPKRNFSPTQRVLVYCEVENHQSARMQTSDGEKFLTRLRGSYLIVDGQGRAIQQGEFPNVEDMALNKRRDFYLFFPIAFQDLPTGHYRLELQVEDLTANRTAAVIPSLEFTVE